jgi:hypothetical protein
MFDAVFVEERLPYLKGSEFIKFYRDHMESNGFYQCKFVLTGTDINNKKKTTSNQPKGVFVYPIKLDIIMVMNEISINKYKKKT